ncbi:hypothetical protein ElyMa_001777100 [Elysia marginata]|uniref:Uncharacterized protein n=1 Tax=Elysia marginata TaxID=1093978 RepID=A0AAV4EDN2_9GAST|nr:hypothetical protein ElyMa_001777100 [Elysia marginata]
MAFLSLLLLTLVVCSGQAFMEDSHDLLVFCRDHMNIENCARTNADTSLSLYDIFDTMTTNVSSLEEMCQNQTVSSCIGPCILEFRATIFGYLQQVCAYLTWIRWEEECWTDQWALEARQCYRWIYPRHRTENPYHGLYPVPYRVYDRAVIARDCFPTASDTVADKCSFYQTWIFQKLLPQYFELHGYPEGFDHIPDQIGFPGI